MVKQYSYGPFGQSDDFKLALAAIDNPLGYTARRLDKDSGVGHDPTNFNDPSGLAGHFAVSSFDDCGRDYAENWPIRFSNCFQCCYRLDYVFHS